MNNIPQETYNTIISNVPIACVDIAILVRGYVLLVKRKDKPAKGQWWLPGGRILKGELMQEASVRKAKEEVGIVCHAGKIIHTAETIFEDGPCGISIHSINSCFLMKPITHSFWVTLDSHHEEYKWVNEITIDMNPYVKACLIKTFKEVDNV